MGDESEQELEARRRIEEWRAKQRRLLITDGRRWLSVGPPIDQTDPRDEPQTDDSGERPQGSQDGSRE